MAPCAALYGRKCRSPTSWDDLGVREMLGPGMVTQSIDLVRDIREKLQIAPDRHKHWADQKRRHVEFDQGMEVFLKISPNRGVIRFGKRGKLSPKFIGPFEIVQRIGSVAYKLKLAPALDGVHYVFHVSQLRRYIPDPSQVIDYREIEVRPNMTYVQQPVEIMDRSQRILRCGKTIDFVRVLWRRDPPGEST